MKKSECPKIKKIPEIKGCYGERYIINSKDLEVKEIFKVISIWTANIEKCEDGSYNITFELPNRHHLEDNPLIMYLLRNVKIEQ